MIRRILCACAGAALVITLAAPAPAPPKSNKDTDVTCPYLRQQKTDCHAQHIAKPDMGREVIDNLRLLKQADHLLDLAKNLARDGFFMEAMQCCDRAAQLCPGSPCAARAADTMRELALGSDENPTITMPNPKYLLESKDSDSDTERLVAGMMDSCYILMSRGMQHEAAKLARQAYAIDPQRVQADPLIYKLHLLTEVPATQTAGASEASEPATCPYCPNSGKPIHEIMPNKTPPAIDYEFEVSANTSGLRLCADCSVDGNVYHLRLKNGLLTIWKTPDASKTKP